MGNVGRQRGWVLCAWGPGWGVAPLAGYSRSVARHCFRCMRCMPMLCHAVNGIQGLVLLTAQGRDVCDQAGTQAGTICARPTLRDGGGIEGWPSGQLGLSPPGSGPTRVVPTRVWPHQGHLVPTPANRCPSSNQRVNKQTNLCPLRTPLPLQTDIVKSRCYQAQSN